MAIVGCGAVAHFHLEALLRCPDVAVVALCDRSAATAGFLGDRFDIPATYTSFDSMIELEEPQSIHVLTPPSTHRGIVESALQAGAHVFCEKPLTPSSDETADLLMLAAACSRHLIENHNYLYNDVVRRLDRLVESGTLGEVVDVEVSMVLDLVNGPFGDPNLSGTGIGLPGGAVHDLLPHLCYLLLHFMGNDSGSADSIDPVAENRSGNARIGFDSLDARVVVDGRRGRVRIASDVQPDAFRIRICGSKASAETDIFQPFVRLDGATGGGKRAPFEMMRSGVELTGWGVRNLVDKVARRGAMHGLTTLVADFYQAIRSNGNVPVTADEILATARLVDQLLGLDR